MNVITLYQKQLIDKILSTYIFLGYIEDITWLHGDTKFLFEC